MGKEKDKRLTMDVPVAGALIGLSRNGSYAAARRGDLPTIKMGRRLLVPRAAFEALLNVKPKEAR